MVLEVITSNFFIWLRGWGNCNDLDEIGDVIIIHNLWRETSVIREKKTPSREHVVLVTYKYKSEIIVKDKYQVKEDLWVRNMGRGGK